MKIFVAGASGAIGKRLLPMLARAGHTVTGTTRHEEKAESIRSAGATPAVLNALNPKEVLDAVQRAKPDVIIHELTAIPPNLNMKHFDKDFAGTNQLRKEGTDHLVAAARAVGCHRFIAQSFAAWSYERAGSWIKTEEDAFVSNPEPECRETIASIRHLESAVLHQRGIDGFALRYGFFYGPGTSIGEGGSTLDMVRQRKLPIIGDGAGYWSFCHIEDAASATLAAVGASTPGIYNITDDEPMQVSAWLPFLAQVLGAKPPRHVPAWLGRLAVGELGVVVMTQIRGVSNQKAKALFGWKPKWPSCRTGFREGLAEQLETMRSRFATAS